MTIERRQEDRDTRDIAVKAQTNIEQHMTDCTQFRITIQNTLSEFRNDIKKLNWNVAMIVGGFVLIGKIIDFLTPHINGISK